MAHKPRIRGLARRQINRRAVRKDLLVKWDFKDVEIRGGGLAEGSRVRRTDAPSVNTDGDEDLFRQRSLFTSLWRCRLVDAQYLD